MQIRYLVDKISFLKYIHCNIPMDNGLVFEMKIDVDNGRVIRNNNCAEHIKFKTGQDNTIILFDKDYNKITWYSEEEKDFVDRYIGEIPSFLNNGEDDDCNNQRWNRGK